MDEKTKKLLEKRDIAIQDLERAKIGNQVFNGYMIEIESAQTVQELDKIIMEIDGYKKKKSRVVIAFNVIIALLCVVFALAMFNTHPGNEAFDAMNEIQKIEQSILIVLGIFSLCVSFVLAISIFD